MSTNFTMMIASPHDALILATLDAQTFEETFAPLNTKENMALYLAQNFNDKILEQELTDKQNTFILFYVDETPIGYVKLCKDSTPAELIGLRTLEIQRFYLKKEFHGTGMAGAMMHICIGIAEEQNAQVLWLAVWEKNPRAIKFYEKFDFVPFGKQIFMMATEEQSDIMMKLEFSSLKKV